MLITVLFFSIIYFLNQIFPEKQRFKTNQIIPICLKIDQTALSKRNRNSNKIWVHKLNVIKFDLLNRKYSTWMPD